MSSHMCHLFLPWYLLTLEGLEMFYFPSHIIQMTKSNILPLGMRWLSGSLDEGWLFLESESLLLSYVQLFETPWIAACQSPLSMGFPRQEYWSGLSFPFPGYLLHPGIKPGSPALQVDSEPPRKTSYSLEEIIVTIIFSESCYFSSVPCVWAFTEFC